MREFIVSFLIKNNRAEETIPNNLIYEIRRKLAETMRSSGFGAVRELDEHKFLNENAKACIDEYYRFDNELHITYIWIFPLETGKGDLERLLNFVENYGLSCVVKTHIL